MRDYAGRKVAGVGGVGLKGGFGGGEEGRACPSVLKRVVCCIWWDIAGYAQGYGMPGHTHTLPVGVCPAGPPWPFPARCGRVPNGRVSVGYPTVGYR